MIVMNMEPHWNDIDRRKPKNSEKTRYQFHFVDHNPTWTDPGRNQGLSTVREDPQSAGWVLDGWTSILSWGIIYLCLQI
jgi:hypothetical protein